MKITIEPTIKTGNNFYKTLTVSMPGDDLDIVAAMDVVQDALRAWGFTDAVLAEWFSK